MESKSTGVAYLLWVPSVFGCAGLYRFYLGRPLSGLLWFFTFGLLGIGLLVDLFYIPLMVESENRRLGLGMWSRPGGVRQLAASRSGPASPRELAAQNPDQAVLQVARQHEGRVTVEMVAMETGFSLRKSKRILERMSKEGYAERDVSTEGAYLYVFRGIVSNEPFEIDDI